MLRCHFLQYFQLTHPYQRKTKKDILNKLLKSTRCTFYIRPLKGTATHLSMFLNKCMPCGREIEAIQERSHDRPDIVDEMRLLSCLYIKRYNNIKWSGKYSSEFMQNCWRKKKRVLLCSLNAWIRTRTMFLATLKQCHRFSVLQSFQSEITLLMTYLQGKR